MISAHDAQTHFRYSTWASRRLLDASLALGEEPLHRDLGVANKSVHGTLCHVLMADRVWLARLTGHVLANPREQTEPIETEWPRILEQWQALSDTWNDADLAGVISYKDMKGTPYETPLWQIVLHVVNHATLHRGQVMAMFRQLGVAPPSTDLIFFYREQKTAHA
jgi:uncharacterized damage-inducible protein DinB